MCCPHTQQRQRLVGTEQSDSVQKEQRRGKDCSCRLWSWRTPARDPRQSSLVRQVPQAQDQVLPPASVFELRRPWAVGAMQCRAPPPRCHERRKHRKDRARKGPDQGRDRRVERRDHEHLLNLSPSVRDRFVPEISTSYAHLLRNTEKIKEAKLVAFHSADGEQEDEADDVLPLPRLPLRSQWGTTNGFL
jgi:hypothetical protein